jgi:hypothetical protein
MGTVLDPGGNPLVRHEGRRSEVTPPPVRLIREQVGQPLVRRAPFIVCRPLDHHGLDHRLPEPELADPVIHQDEMVAFGRPEAIESRRPARRRQDAQASGAVEGGKQEQASRRLGKSLDPGSVQRPHLPARAGGDGSARRSAASSTHKGWVSAPRTDSTGQLMAAACAGPNAHSARAGSSTPKKGSASLSARATAPGRRSRAELDTTPTPRRTRRS